MPCYCEWAKRGEVPSIFESNQAERDDDQKDGFLMNMPAKKERGISTQGDSADKGIPIRTTPELHQGNQLKDQSQSKCHLLGDLRQNRERGIPNQTSGHAVKGLLVDGKTETRGNYKKEGQLLIWK